MILFDESYLILGKSYKINDDLIVNNPKVREILEYGEEDYLHLLSSIISTPFDCKVQLFDMGHDFETFDSVRLFHMLICGSTPEQTKILFGDDVDFSSATLFLDSKINEYILLGGNVYIDALAHTVMSEFLRRINGIPVKKPEKYTNEHTKQYRLEIERSELKEKKKLKFTSHLLPLISALANSSESKYDYRSVMDLTISQLHDSVERISKIKNYEHIMQGVYSGSIQSDKVSSLIRDSNWLA